MRNVEPNSCLFLLLMLRLPGDSRTRIGFITFDSTVQFYNLQEGLSQPQMLIVSDIDGKSQESGDINFCIFSL